jgi:hypothetical protein
MKKILTLALLTLPFVIEAQTPKTKPLFYSLNQINDSFKSPVLDYKNYFEKAAFYDLQIYSPTIGLIENYSFVSDNQYDRNDEFSLVYRTNQRMNINSASLYMPFNNNRVDSLNPYGARSIGESLGLGLINTLLNINSL